MSTLGAVLAVVFVLGHDDKAGGQANPPRAATTESKQPAVAKHDAGAVHFTVSASGDLLMHQPLLDRARANAGGSGYDFAPFFDKIAPYIAKVELGLCHVETPMGPGPITTYPIFNTPSDLAKSIHRSGWDACDTASNHSLDGAQAGIDGTVGRTRPRRRQAHRLVYLEEAQQRADVPSRRRDQDRLRRLHRRDQRLYPAAFVVAQHLPGREPEGRREGDHPRRPQGSRQGRRRGDRAASLGRRELADAERVAASPSQRSSPMRR